MKRHTKLPKRIYCSGEKKMVSMRLPTKLMSETLKLAENKGWNVTDVVMTAIDEYLQWEKKED